MQASSKQMPNDAELIAGLRARDEAAMNALYERYSGIVYAVALRVLSETSLAEDILQDVFLQLWRNPGAFDASRGALGAWLAVIARHKAIDVLRKRRPQSDLEEVVISFEAPLAEDASRPVLLYSRFATCMQPRLKGLTTMTNSRFNGWRMEDVWLDR